MKAAVPVFVILTIAAALATAMIVVGRLNPPPPPPLPAGGENPLAPSERTTDLKIPEFEGVNQDGQPVSHELFDGRISIVDFIFTNCPLACPMMSDRMMVTARDLKGTDVQFVSISMDPERDTPERLREYGAMYEADFSRWTFITGEKEELRSIAADGLKFAVEDNPDDMIPLPDGTTMPNIIHGTWFALIGPDRQVLDLFQSSSEPDLLRLVEWAKRADKAVNSAE